MTVTDMDRCSHPNCSNYSDIASTACTKCDELLEGHIECSQCGQPGGII